MDFMKKLKEILFIAKIFKRVKKTGGEWVGQRLSYSFNKQDKLYRIRDWHAGEIRESESRWSAAKNAYEILENYREAKERYLAELKRREEYEI